MQHVKDRATCACVQQQTIAIYVLVEVALLHAPKFDHETLETSSLQEL